MNTKLKLTGKALVGLNDLSGFKLYGNTLTKKVDSAMELNLLNNGMVSGTEDTVVVFIPNSVINKHADVIRNKEGKMLGFKWPENIDAAVILAAVQKAEASKMKRDEIDAKEKAEAEKNFAKIKGSFKLPKPRLKAKKINNNGWKGF